MTAILDKADKLRRIKDDALKHGFQAVFIKDWEGRQGKLWQLSSCASNCAISPACLNCPVVLLEAKRLAELREKGKEPNRVRAKCLTSNLLIPLRWGKRHMCFVCPQGDLFHADIPSSFIAQVFAVMTMRPQDCYIVLTKRATRLASLLCSPFFAEEVLIEGQKLFGEDFMLPDDWGHNTLIGVSVEDQARMVRAEALTCLPKNFGKVLFVAPMLENIVIPPHVLAVLDWVVCNRERGSTYCNPRPCEVEWIKSLKEQCADAHVPFFLEDRWTKEAIGVFGGMPREYPSILAR